MRYGNGKKLQKVRQNWTIEIENTIDALSSSNTIDAISGTISDRVVELVNKKIDKRSDIDLQTCLENFNVHKDKIIRTQDSKNMGAKYINEIDLGSREECMRLCCETENCDVFVFEEKNSGSCYLFQCGPPEDFKCKFTHHANYSSAILAVNRHLPDLESQIKLTKHEQELAKLRKPEVEVEKSKNLEMKTTPSTTTVTEAKIVTAPPTKRVQQTKDTAKCSRYQFECRSTKECIAIYNACDGIPQCADGSDEGPELECPDAMTTPQSTHVHHNPTFEEIPINQNRPIIPQALPNRKYYQQPLQQREQINVQMTNPQRTDPDFIRPDLQNSLMSRPPALPYERANVPQYQQIPAQIQNNWASRQQNQMAQPYQQFEDRNSHIFNHKESGLQVSEGQDIRYNKHKGAMQVLHRALGYSSAGQGQYPDVAGKEIPKIGNYIEDPYRQNEPYQDKWIKPPSRDDRFNNRISYVPEPIPNRLETNWQQPIPPGMDYGKDFSHNTFSVSAASDDRNKPYYQTSQEQSSVPWKIEKPADFIQEHDHEHEKMAQDLKHSKNLMEKVSDQKQIKIEKVEKVHHHGDGAQYPKVAAYKVAEVLDLQDGITDTPSGAVLSLTLGLIITVVMALLIGCRLRVVRRRIRRGGKSYAHDADYLVNGMYL
ncbi:hypothetical protein FQR65_LT03420 [Abscondita terminalis]|nr:hypothetical protein FQR65_LT03420 [Abscondita terminalis]